MVETYDILDKARVAAQMQARRVGLRPNFRVEIVEPKHVYLLSEHTTHALTGRLYCMVAPYLDGTYRRDEIYTLLSDTLDQDLIDAAIDRLLDGGLAVELDDSTPPHVAAFWSELGLSPIAAVDTLRAARVTVISVGGGHTDAFVSAVRGFGIAVDVVQVGDLGTLRGSAPDLMLVAADDYLRPELERINTAALALNIPWMLVKSGGSQNWFGPVFVPRQTGCWRCLAHRLMGNVEIKLSIARQRGLDYSDPSVACFPTAVPALPSTVALATHRAAVEVAKWLVGHTLADAAEGTAQLQTLAGRITTLDHLTGEQSAHALPHRPQCKACGDPDVVSRAGFEPLALSPSPKSERQDGGHRSMTPEQTLDAYDHLISPISGVVMELSRISDPGSAEVNTYRATHSMGAVGSLRGLRKVLRHNASGKGKTDAQARVSGLCEAIERYSFIHQGDEPTRTARKADLGDAAIAPEALLHFSDTQYDNRDALNDAAAMSHDWIPQRFDPERETKWTPVWSLTEDQQRFLPSAYCYQWFPLPSDYKYCRADSNGNAAGSTREDAILQGLLEVVERDGVALWWYNAVQRPAVDLDSFGDPYFAAMKAHYQTLGREFWVIDLSTDMNVPTMAAVSRRITGGSERLIIGYGAHLDPTLAAVRAVTEMSQVGLELDKIPDAALDIEAGSWLTQATLATKPYLAPDPTQPARRAEDYDAKWSDDIRDDVMTCVAAAKRIGVETLVLDLTRPDIKLPVVKVVMPGLRFFWKRFAPGRLYDAPVSLGWRDAALTEAGLNHTPMPF